MIKQIKLHNFQSHEDTTIDFTSGVNALVGKTDSGKTACIRALKWVATNRPGGDSFIKHGAPSTKVTVVTDKHVIEREKSSNKNTYTLDGNVFNAVGTNIPEEVADALNFDDISIQFQMDKPFLLTETSGEVARRFNKVVNLDDIDSTLQEITRYRKKQNTLKDSIETRLTQLDEMISSMDLTYIENTVELAEIIEKKKDIIIQDVSFLSDNLDEIRSINAIIEHEAEIGHCIELLNSLEYIYQEREKMSHRQSSLLSDINELTTAEKLIQKQQEIIDNTSVDVITKLFETYKEYIDMHKQLEYLLKEFNSIDTIEEVKIDVDATDCIIKELNETLTKEKDIMNILSTYEEYNTSIQKQVEEVAEMEKSLKEELGNTCPVCGNRIA